jgi:hypothetical protein
MDCVFCGKLKQLEIVAWGETHFSIKQVRTVARGVQFDVCRTILRTNGH